MIPGQYQIEHAAPSGRAAHSDAAALRLHQSTRERQAEAGALMLLAVSGVELLKVNEQPRQVGFSDTDAVIFGVVQF